METSTTSRVADWLGSGSVAAIVFDVSQTGAEFRCPVALAEGAEIALALPAFCEKQARILWRDGDLYGCRFTVPLRLTDTNFIELGAARVRTDLKAGRGATPSAGFVALAAWLGRMLRGHRPGLSTN